MPQQKTQTTMQKRAKAIKQRLDRKTQKNQSKRKSDKDPISVHQQHDAFEPAA